MIDGGIETTRMKRMRKGMMKRGERKKRRRRREANEEKKTG